MAASQNESPEEAYFNDLSQQMPGDSNAAEAEERRASQEDNGQLPKQKRIACVLCRKRKLKCDGQRPACATCTRLQHDCVYDEVRRKSGPKRGYVKALEARLAQVETLLKTQDEPASRKQQRKTGQDGSIGPGLDHIALGQDMQPAPPRTFNMSNTSAPSQSLLDGTNTAAAPNVIIEEPFSWDMIWTRPRRAFTCPGRDQRAKPNLLRQDPTFAAHDPPAAILRSDEPGATRQAAGGFTIRDVGQRSVRHRQVRGPSRASLPAREEVHAPGRDERAW